MADIEAAFSVLGLPVSDIGQQLQSSASAGSGPSSSVVKKLPTHPTRKNDGSLSPMMSELHEPAEAPARGALSSDIPMVSYMADAVARSNHPKSRSALNSSRLNGRYRRIAVQLREGKSEITLDLEENIEHQVELFLLSNLSGSVGMNDSDANHSTAMDRWNTHSMEVARQKLTHLARILQRDYRINSSHPSPPHISTASSGKAFSHARGGFNGALKGHGTIKIKLAIPLNSSSVSPNDPFQNVDVIVSAGEDLTSVAEKKARRFSLNAEQQNSIYDQIVQFLSGT